jgi:hypothetical protein
MPKRLIRGRHLAVFGGLRLRPGATALVTPSKITGCWEGRQPQRPAITTTKCRQPLQTQNINSRAVAEGYLPRLR